ncbi:MAG: UDP-N-acetylglucosamine--N-acetylmuramyl-(pentapeptide) pyrophosphoryl-undecaprenol N-acetylglucosamine transferase [Oscillospiraceae bacterium]|jgi:UDP-N-acetylglucosamine--N-acetylmuramyl-(pentapeptide) pyrophosphoryl-undecaprenol N-acetylglucosamine transferase|nr:UDP-N-acetylglucosamine--N-acetylmuramyl-(pentapeptide) pyrophosphoryl-undecaprenol N-acetylglucosamine transferase [Oscillospiraceae bacterium]
MKVLFACGGTGGHINPAIAVAQRLRELHPDCAVLFVGAVGGMERQLIPKEGFDAEYIKVRNLVHRLTPSAAVKNIKSAALLAGAFRQSARIIKAFAPDVVVGTGAYVSYPVLRKAAAMGLPTLTHESNVFPGLTTKLLAKRVDRVLTGFDGARERYPRPGNVIFTGTPVRSAFYRPDKQAAKKSLGLDDRPVLAVAFGSLGARDMNRVMADVITLIARDGDTQVLMATGKAYYQWFPRLLREKGITAETHPHIRISEYFHNMPAIMAASDLLLSRAGTSTLGELTACGLPAILVPSPNVTRGHQETNARELEKTGGVLVRTESGIDAAALHADIRALLFSTDTVARMSAALRSAAVPDAADRVCGIIAQMCEKKRGGKA